MSEEFFLAAQDDDSNKLVRKFKINIESIVVN